MSTTEPNDTPKPSEPPAAGSPPSEPPTPEPGDVKPPPVPAADGTGGGEDDDAFLSWKVLVAVAVVLAVVAVGAWVLVGSRKKDESSTRTGNTVPAGEELPAIRDDFDRPDNATTLGKTTTGEDWEAVTGTWGVKDKQAYVAAKNTGGPRNMAVVDLGSGDGSVQAKMAKLVDGWGLAFRVRGPNSWWAIKAVPKVGTLNVVKFKDGDEVRVDNVGLVKFDDNTTIRVEFVGDLITVFVNGNPQRTFKDSYLMANGTKAGLFVEGPAVTDARWSEFVARKGSNGPPVTATPKPGTPGGGGGGTKPAAGGGGGGGAASTTRPSGPTTTKAPTTTSSEPTGGTTPAANP